MSTPDVPFCAAAVMAMVVVLALRSVPPRRRRTMLLRLSRGKFSLVEIRDGAIDIGSEIVDPVDIRLLEDEHGEAMADDDFQTFEGVFEDFGDLHGVDGVDGDTSQQMDSHGVLWW
jgi:hypothetical protein